MSAAITLPAGVELCHLPSPFRLRRGGDLACACLAYERHGPRHAPVVAVLGGISAHRHVAANARQPAPGWWPGVVGQGLGIDIDRFQVLSFDWLGGVGDSSTPAAGESFPFVDAGDQAQALWCLCDALRIERLHAIVGSSYGGMVGLHAASQQPQRVERLIAIAAAHKSHPQASAWRQVQRGIVEFGRARGDATTALALARALAMTTYRSPRELADRFVGGEQDGELHGWLAARGDAFASVWHTEQFLCLNRSIDGHTIEPAAVTAPTFLLAFDSDQLVPTRCVRELALGLPDLRCHRELASRYGHDAFLKEPQLVGAFLREALR